MTRNPTYVGMAGVLTAHALLRGGWPEEAALRDLFGQQYDDYCRRVRRWL